MQLRIRWLAKQIGLVDDITPNEFGEWSERADKAGAANREPYTAKRPIRSSGSWCTLG